MDERKVPRFIKVTVALAALTTYTSMAEAIRDIDLVASIILHVSLVVLNGIVLAESMMNDGWLWNIGRGLRRVYMAINRPLINHYEARERNYKQVIQKLERQLYEQQNEGKINGTVKKEAPVVMPTGSPAGLRPPRYMGASGTMSRSAVISSEDDDEESRWKPVIFTRRKNDAS